MTLREWLLQSKLDYSEAIYLAKAVLGQEILDMECELNKLPLFCLNTAATLRNRKMPLAKIVEQKYFMNYSFITTTATLDPRPESESLIESISIKPRSILDLGTGTGCLIISAMKRFSKAKGVGVDISPEALAVAAENARVMQVDKKLTLLCNNWANGLTGHYDVILANPPYIVGDYDLPYEPKQALVGDENTYIELMNSIKVSFYELIFEIPEELVEKVKQGVTLKHDELTVRQVYDTRIYIMKLSNQLHF